MFLFGNEVFLFDSDMCLSENDMPLFENDFLFGNDVFLFGNDVVPCARPRGHRNRVRILQASVAPGSLGGRIVVAAYPKVTRAGR